MLRRVPIIALSLSCHSIATASSRMSADAGFVVYFVRDPAMVLAPASPQSTQTVFLRRRRVHCCPWIAWLSPLAAKGRHGAPFGSGRRDSKLKGTVLGYFHFRPHRNPIPSCHFYYWLDFCFSFTSPKAISYLPSSPSHPLLSTSLHDFRELKHMKNRFREACS